VLQVKEPLTLAGLELALCLTFTPSWRSVQRGRGQTLAMTRRVKLHVEGSWQGANAARARTDRR
jgi:hypothetical protein